jgi:hypothetical protein
MRHRLRKQFAITKLITDYVFEVIEIFQASDFSKTPNAASELTKRSAWIKTEFSI